MKSLSSHHLSYNTKLVTTYCVIKMLGLKYCLLLSRDNNGWKTASLRVVCLIDHRWKNDLFVTRSCCQEKTSHVEELIVITMPAILPCWGLSRVIFPVWETLLVLEWTDTDTQNRYLTREWIDKNYADKTDTNNFYNQMILSNVWMTLSKQVSNKW